MNIGEAARASGVSAKMIRYYESVGMIPAVGRSGAGYRLYTPAEVNTLRFIGRARAFGLPMQRIKLLVSLWQDRNRASRDVKRIAIEHVESLRRKIADLEAMANALQQLAETCQGDHRPDCPILEDFGRGDAARSPDDAGPDGRDDDHDEVARDACHGLGFADDRPSH